MSAKQPVSRSRGKRSRKTGSPGAIGPGPISWPTAVCGPCETMNSSADAPCAVNACSTASLSRSQVSGSPSSVSVPFSRSAARSSSRAAAIPASAARCARRIPASSASFFTRRRSTNCEVGGHGDPVGAQVVGELERERGRNDGVVEAEVPRRAQHELELDLLAVEALREQLVEPEVLEREDLELGGGRGDPVELERAHDSVPVAVALE